MEIILFLAVVVVVAAVAVNLKGGSSSTSSSRSMPSRYFYRKKTSLMTAAESEFYNRLMSIAGDRYYIFPQIHLSSLMTNETKGKYSLSGFQRINRRSVDYVLCDKQTFQPVYAIELDDATHDQPKRRARDAMVEKMFSDVNIPLIRFRDFRGLSDDDIIQKFQAANR